jgi:hypothetical protein
MPANIITICSGKEKEEGYERHAEGIAVSAPFPISKKKGTDAHVGRSDLVL